MIASSTQANPTASRIALEVMVEAYKSLAMVYEAAYPGRYITISYLMKQHLADFIRAIANEFNTVDVTHQDFEAAIGEIRAILLTVEREVVRQPVTV